jgi:hypothetical protein
MAIPGASGDESQVRDFIIDFVKSNQHGWHNRPEIIWGDDFQDCVILKFGKPRLAAFARRHGNDYKTLKLLNPWLRSDKLNVRKGKSYTIQLLG